MLYSTGVLSLLSKTWPVQDFAIDLHTQSRGNDYPLYVFADYRNPKVQVIAENLNAEQIKIDAGEGMGFGVPIDGRKYSFHIGSLIFARVALVAYRYQDIWLTWPQSPKT